MINLIKSLLQKIKVHNQFFNPFYTWWQCRHYFKFPKVSTYYGEIIWFYGLPIRNDYYNRFIDFRTSNVGWKTKYDSIRFEWNPYIAFTLLRKWQYIIIFSYGDNTNWNNETTWESMLEYSVRNTPLNKLYCNKDYIVDNLTIKGILLLNKQ